MTNKEIFIDRELMFAKLNRLLILNDPNYVASELLRKYGLYEVLDYIDFYCESLKNICFISYFPDIRKKFISVLEIIIFCLKKVGTNFPNSDNEIIIEEEIDNLFMQIKKLEKLDIQSNELEKILLSYRNIDNTNNPAASLRMSYVVDEEVIKYLNGKCESLSVKENNRVCYICSLIYYCNTVGIILDEDTLFEKMEKISFLSSPGLEAVKNYLYYLFSDIIKKNYLISLEDCDYIASFGEQKIRSKKREKLPHNVIKMTEYLKKR